jgi:hypothetical protein
MMKILKVVSWILFLSGGFFLSFGVILSFILNGQVATYLQTHSLADKAIALQTLGINERLMPVLFLAGIAITIGLIGIGATEHFHIGDGD